MTSLYDPPRLAPEPGLALAINAKDLRRPFAAEAIKFRPAGGGLVLAYIDARVVIERLNHVVPGLWSTEFEPYPGGPQIICHLTIDGVTRSDVGTQSKGQAVDPVKGGYSDALKRAAVHFGVGVSIYALARVRQSKMPSGCMDGSALTDAGEDWLRDGYRKWLTNTGLRAFGQPLDHGDIEGSVGDVEAEHVFAPGEVVKAPSPEYMDHLARLTGAYETLTTAQRKGLSRAKFKQQLAACENETDLTKLDIEIAKRRQ